MRVAIFSTKPYDRTTLESANAGRHEMRFFEPRLTPDTAALAEGFDAVCVFVNDTLSAPVIEVLARGGVRLIALRCAGFNNVDLAAADRLGVGVVRVPAYSPYAVAEHAVGLMLALNRRIHRAHARVREGNFSLDGLMGFDMHGKTAGVVGLGRIGLVAARILKGFGCRMLVYDPTPSADPAVEGFEAVELDRLFAESHLVTLHCPLIRSTRHLIDAAALASMRDGVILINTSRGGLVDTPATIEALKSGKVGALGLDVYEEEAELFFEDLSNLPLQDDVFARLLTFPNVIVTGHQAFFTHEALANIAETTIGSIDAFARDGHAPYQICPHCT